MTKWLYLIRPKVILVSAILKGFTTQEFVTDIQITGADLTALTANFIIVSETQIP